MQGLPNHEPTVSDILNTMQDARDKLHLYRNIDVIEKKLTHNYKGVPLHITHLDPHTER